MKQNKKIGMGGLYSWSILIYKIACNRCQIKESRKPMLAHMGASKVGIPGAIPIPIRIYVRMYIHEQLILTHTRMQAPTKTSLCTQ